MSQNQIARTQEISKHSVQAVADAAGIGWAEAEKISDAEVYAALFPEKIRDRNVYPDPGELAVNAPRSGSGQTESPTCASTSGIPSTSSQETPYRRRRETHPSRSPWRPATSTLSPSPTVPRHPTSASSPPVSPTMPDASLFRGNTWRRERSADRREPPPWQSRRYRGAISAVSNGNTSTGARWYRFTLHPVPRRTITQIGTNYKAVTIRDRRLKTSYRESISAMRSLACPSP